MPEQSAGGQLYAQLAQLLAPPDALGAATSTVVLEPAGKDVAAIAALGGAEAAEALSDLVDAVPAAAATFLDTGTTYADAWDFVLANARPTGPVGDPVRETVAQVLNDNRTDVELMRRVRVAAPLEEYLPASAAPADWLGADGWAGVSFRIGGDDPDPPPPPPPHVVVPTDIPDLNWRDISDFVVTDPLHLEPPKLKIPVPVHPGQPIKFPDPKVWEIVTTIRAAQEVVLPTDMRWQDVGSAFRLLDYISEARSAEPTGTGFRLSFEYRAVGLRRPWLHLPLCRLAGWWVPGLPAGGVSNGQVSGNDGLIPLLTTRMLVVRNLVVEAHWSPADRAMAASVGTMAFGPFTVAGEAGFDGSRLARARPQVVAWLATALPACPPG